MDSLKGLNSSAVLSLGPFFLKTPQFIPGVLLAYDSLLLCHLLRARFWAGSWEIFQKQPYPAAEEAEKFKAWGMVFSALFW